MSVTEDSSYSEDYLDPDKRSIANSVEVRFADGTSTGPVVVDYPIGHRRRRDEAWPLLAAKLRQGLEQRLSSDAAATVMSAVSGPAALDEMTVQEFLRLFTTA